MSPCFILRLENRWKIKSQRIEIIMRKRKLFLAALICLLILGAAVMSPEVFLTANTQAQSKTKEIKVRGYVTKVNSPTSFEIDNYLISRDASLAYELDKQTPEVSFKPEDIRIGTELEVRGDFNEQTNELKAKKIKIDLSQFRKFKITTILNQTPEGIEKTEQGWRGVINADGNRIRIEPATPVLFELNKTEKKKAEEEAKRKAKEAKDKKSKEEVNTDDDDDDENSEFAPLTAISDVKAGMLMTYEGTQQPDGTVAATRVVFMRNETAKDEAEMWDSLKTEFKAANLAEGKPGELKINKVGKFKLLMNEEVQKYVLNLGQSLIPAFQKNLPEGDPLKIPFRFFVIVDKSPNAFALPNGIVVVHSGLFNIVENEAQLAYILGHEIAHATQEHTLRQMNKDKKKRTALQIGSIAAMILGAYAVSDILDLTLAAMVNGYQRTLENQADRVGLDYMVAAGYDPREAPKVWQLMGKKYGSAPTNFFWSSHENHSTRRSFLMYQIRSNYSDSPLDQMNKGNAEEFQKISLKVAESAQKKKK